MKRLLVSLWTVGLVLGCIAACNSVIEPRIVYITATPDGLTPGNAAGNFTPASPLPSQPTVLAATQVSNPTDISPTGDTQTHTVQSGDTLYGIAVAYNTSLDTLLALNDLEDANILTVGQTIVVPSPPDETTPGFVILPDALLIRSPASRDFDVTTFINSQPGYIRRASDEVDIRLANGATVSVTMSAAEIVDRVATEFSVDPRLLLALLEYRAGWLSNEQVSEALQTHPLISEADSAIDREGLYRQLAYTANELNRGFYGYKYDGWDVLEFNADVRLSYNRDTNPATIGIQYFLSLNNTYVSWQRDVNEGGLYRVYRDLFGAPPTDRLFTEYVVEQPQLQLPFPSGETWFFTGGPHGGWGSGSAWAALDFAPPDDRQDGVLCFTSDYDATAVADGIIVRSQDGVVVLDLDGDGDETTGWTILYLHITSAGSAVEGSRVMVGDPIGKPSCQGGFSTATHMHIARRYNGEWIPATCHACPANTTTPPFTMSNWMSFGLRNQEYQGFLQRGSDRRQAEQGRNNPINRVSW